MLTGIIIGLLMGIMLALGVAIWLNRAHTPFLEKSPPVNALPTITPRPVVPPATKNEKGEAEKPRFEFYQILPGDKGGSATERPAASAPAVTKAPSPPEPKPAVKAETGASKETPKSPASETLYLQAGAFQSETDAENLKAKIAFAGFEANVRAVNLPDKGTLYRVRLGPYKSPDEVNRIKATLSQNGINAAVVRAGD
jgi:cell division protein FtsN